jgi:hypothetical protein
MPLSLPPLLAATNPQTAALTGNTPERLNKSSSQTVGANTAAIKPELAKEESKKVTTSDAVTLSPANDAVLAAQRAAIPYAEIWRDGRKVAAVDSTGEISSFEGTVAAPPGGGSGIALAAQRAVLIARSLGGEIRVAGQVTDPATLTMQTRLRAAYGV